MKKYLPSFFAFLFFVVMITTAAIGQDSKAESDRLLNQGVALHDSGLYQAAIEKYKEALKLNPGEPLLYYEIAYSFYSDDKLDSALKYSNYVLATTNRHNLQAYMIAGNVLDDQGKSAEAQALYKKALKQYPDDYLVHYNYGLSFYRSDDFKNAEKHLQLAIRNKPSHASSHLTLAYLQFDRGLRGRGMISLYFFLLLENETERAAKAWEKLNNAWLSGAGADPEDPSKITIYVNNNEKDKGIHAMEIFASLMMAQRNSDEYSAYSDEEIFAIHTEKFFAIMSEVKEKKKDFYWSFYCNFFKELAAAKHVEAFAYYISLPSGKQQVRDWLDENSFKLEEFGKWLSE